MIILNTVILRPEINFRAESSSLLKQASAYSRAIYRSAATEEQNPEGMIYISGFRSF